MEVSVPFEIRPEIFHEANKVTADGDSEYKSHCDPERAIQIGIWTDSVQKKVLVESGRHRTEDFHHNFICIDVKVFLVIFNLPNRILCLVVGLWLLGVKITRVV